MEKDIAIKVTNMTKTFKLYSDKPNTMKERLVRGWKKNNNEVHTVLKDIDLEIKKGETVALIGVNGSGKSTLLRLLSQNELPSSGNIKLGHNVKFSYYSQESAMNINYSNTVWEEARSVSSKLNDVERAANSR